MSLVYEELRRLAAHKLAQKAPGQTLQATALVHEAWAKCFDEVATQSRTESLRLVARRDSFDLEVRKLKPGRNYTLETSQDLAVWTAQESFTAVEGTNTLTTVASPGAPNMRLFRLAW